MLGKERTGGADERRVGEAWRGGIPSGMRGSSLTLRVNLAQPFSFMNLLSQSLAQELPGGRGSSAGGTRTHRRQRTTGWYGPPTILVRPWWAISLLCCCGCDCGVGKSRPHEVAKVEVRRALRELAGVLGEFWVGGRAGFQRRNADAIGWNSARKEPVIVSRHGHTFPMGIFTVHDLIKLGFDPIFFTRGHLI